MASPRGEGGGKTQSQNRAKGKGSCPCLRRLFVGKSSKKGETSRGEESIVHLGRGRFHPLEKPGPDKSKGKKSAFSAIEVGRGGSKEARKKRGSREEKVSVEEDARL